MTDQTLVNISWLVVVLCAVIVIGFLYRVFFGGPGVSDETYTSLKELGFSDETLKKMSRSEYDE